MMFKIYSNILIIITLFYGFIPFTVASSDCDTLSSFYSYLKGSLLEDFLLYKDCCNVVGITCNSSGYVTNIEIKNFENSDADFKTAIKVATGFTHLESLILTNNKSKNGVILPDEIGNFKKIKILNISSNKAEKDSVSTIPESIGDLETLEELDLSKNNLSGSIPNNIANLKNLKQLNLNGNSLSGTLPYTMKDLSNLQRLNLNGNDELKGYAPLLEHGHYCNYSGTNLCHLKSDDCSSGISGCTIQEIQMTNKENGAPEISTYESEVCENGDKTKTTAGGGIALLIFFLIMGYCFYRCCCRCCDCDRPTFSSKQFQTVNVNVNNTNNNSDNNPIPVITTTPVTTTTTATTATTVPPAAYIPPAVTNNTYIYGSVNNGSIINNNGETANQAPPPYTPDPNVSGLYAPPYMPAPAPAPVPVPVVPVQPPYTGYPSAPSAPSEGKF
ncbi:L domain-like protein [Anaeromyces robustus]|uniref:L domain-like protein n=1 Tax=Anaeromyces robustus TaxID=1754192 RepID=A0A1Y1XJ99_9FUNG|nr:L domain-like protein [Anaeromyces robustus]|eukprot:ORX85837.1 L domain-like protein [Anaeromyces robustus]